MHNLFYAHFLYLNKNYYFLISLSLSISISPISFRKLYIDVYLELKIILIYFLHINALILRSTTSSIYIKRIYVKA